MILQSVLKHKKRKLNHNSINKNKARGIREVRHNFNVDRENIKQGRDLRQRSKRNKIDKRLRFDGLFVEYLNDIEKCTGKKISETQRKLIKDAVEKNHYYRLTTQQSHAHRSKFNKDKHEMIKGWESHYHQKWPTYDEQVITRKGKIARLKGQKFDVHEIILNSWGSPHEWYNAWPAASPYVHQQQIHRKGGCCDKIFG